MQSLKSQNFNFMEVSAKFLSSVGCWWWSGLFCCWPKHLLQFSYCVWWAQKILRPAIAAEACLGRVTANYRCRSKEKEEGRANVPNYGNYASCLYLCHWVGEEEKCVLRVLFRLLLFCVMLVVVILAATVNEWTVRLFSVFFPLPFAATTWIAAIVRLIFLLRCPTRRPTNQPAKHKCYPQPQVKHSAKVSRTTSLIQIMMSGLLTEKQVQPIPIPFPTYYTHTAHLFCRILA